MRLALPSWRPNRLHLHTGVISAMLVACLLLLVLDVRGTWQSSEAAIRTDETQTSNLARALAQHAHDTIRTTDVILSGLRERIEAEAPSPDRTDRIERLIAMRVGAVPALFGLAVFDASGARLAGERNARDDTFTVGDRAYFEYHHTHTDRGVHLGDAILSRADGQWCITVSRRVDDPRGGFAGVVRGRISVPFLRDFYAGFDVGPRGVISLVSMRGIVIARTNSTDARTGVDVSSGPLFRRVSTGAPSGSFRYVGVLDGVTRLGSFRTIDDYPLYVVVSHAIEDVLADWHANTLRHLAVSLFVSAVLGLAAVRFAGHVRTRQRAERRYRLLAETPDDAIVCTGLDGSPRYVSPAFIVLTGWSAGKGVAGRWADIVHPDDRQILAKVVPRLLSGEDQVTPCFRCIHANGSLLWVEARARLLETPEGETQLIVTVRDIAHQRAAEARLAVPNRKLVEQAKSDKPIEPADSRHFDEVLG